MARSTLLSFASVTAFTLSLGPLGCADSDAGGDGRGDGDGGGAGDGDGDAPELAECEELGEAAGLIVGEPVEPVASSTPDRMATLGAETWPLALEMLSVVQPATQANLANSPASMFAALGMNYGRYETGECGQRIVEVMGFPETGSDLHNTLGQTLEELRSRSFAADDSSGGLTITVMQSMWMFNATELPEPTELQQYYGATQFGLGAPGEAARAYLNCFVEAQSQGLLKEFFEPGKPQSDTATYDLNVSFLAGAWNEAMSPIAVSFTNASGVEATRDGFTAGAEGGYQAGTSFTSFDLPLAGGEVSVLFVLPNDEDPAGIDAFADALTAEELELARGAQVPTHVDFSMPELAVKGATIDYGPLLGFDCPPFDLRDVLHNAAVEFDEKGIKAAAATAAETWDDGGGPPAPTEEFHLDRPFLFFVYDHATDFVLFSGRYLGT